MKDARIKKITLREVRTEDDVSTLEATINDDGDLVRFSGTLGNNNRSIRARFTPDDGNCQWNK